MGKGDKKSRKGKISMGSYGNTRPHQPKDTGAKAKDGGDANKTATA